jgi:hypothetical protein
MRIFRPKRAGGYNISWCLSGASPLWEILRGLDMYKKSTEDLYDMLTLADFGLKSV